MTRIKDGSREIPPDFLLVCAPAPGATKPRPDRFPVGAGAFCRRRLTSHILVLP